MASRNFLSVASRSSGWTRCTQSSWRFVDRLRRQSVDLQILQRPAIAETGPQIDLEATDPADLLHAREFRLAFPQRDGRKIILGHVAANDEHPADTVIFVDRAEAVGPVDLLQLAVTRDWNELIFMPGRTAAAHHLLDLATDNVPDFRPAFPSALTERARMAFGTQRPAIGVVIKLDEMRPPPDEHRVVGIEQQPYGRPQTLRPDFRGAQRAGRPVVSPRQCAHFPAAGEKIRRTRYIDFHMRNDR